MTPATNSQEQSPKLQPNILQLRHAVVMVIAAMSPVGAIFFNTIPQAGVVGAAMPLCYIIGFGVALLVAHQIILMAAKFPTSGSLYTLYGTVCYLHACLRPCRSARNLCRPRLQTKRY
ncbi:MAG: APC family permease [Chroococcidiopsidaceae cyanobacterium CP_BM_ER_R8_30]|nr:APC family permease [Chroococcidiopsidaceae cyanobacterium CP_BM_ER_R8_30]